MYGVLIFYSLTSSIYRTSCHSNFILGIELIQPIVKDYLSNFSRCQGLFRRLKDFNSSFSNRPFFHSVLTQNSIV